MARVAVRQSVRTSLPQARGGVLPGAAATDESRMFRYMPSLVEPRDVAGNERGHRTQHHRRRDEPEHAAARTQHRALGQQLAAHTASARWRATPRASSSPATLMQAISSTRGGRQGQGQKCRPIRADHLFPATAPPARCSHGTDQIRAEIHPKDSAGDLGRS